MHYRVAYKQSVGRDLKRLAKAEAARILDRIEKTLGTTPAACPPLTGAFAGLRRLRVGDYRVMYALMGDEVLVLRIAHRREVCRKPL